MYHLKYIKFQNIMYHLNQVNYPIHEMSYSQAFSSFL